MAENNTPSAQKRAPGRPFQKGQSGNPGGRPKGFSALIREQTENGEELVQFALAVFRGEMRLPKGAPGKGLDEPPTLEDRRKALEWLADRGWGKAQQSVDLSGADGAPLAFIIDLGAKK